MRLAILEEEPRRDPLTHPYSQAVVASGRLLFVSGKGPLDPATKAVIRGPFAEQVRLTLTNLQTVVEAAGGRLEDAVKVNVYLRDMANFAELNAIYAGFFPEPRPARTTCQSDLDGIDVEIDAVVALDPTG